MESIDASSFMKLGEKTFELLDHFVEHIGEQNVVQVITDNRSNYVLASKVFSYHINFIRFFIDMIFLIVKSYITLIFIKIFLVIFLSIRQVTRS